tara:strand:- start:8372 stop:12412 length:4041 start_codon:yes stop_codon:yes gene_type:complete
MSLSATYHDLSAFSPIHLKDKDDKIEFINQDKFTLQGLNLLTYNINKSANDSFVKNYTVNNLITNKNSNDIFKLTNIIDTQDLNTKLVFKSTQNSVSASFFTQVITTRDDEDSLIIFDIDLSSIKLARTFSDKFLVDFIDNSFCTVSLFDGKVPKFMFDGGSDKLVFKFLNTEKLALTTNYYFNYFYDASNNILRLYKNDNIVTTITTILTTNVNTISTNADNEQVFVTQVLSTNIPSLGLSGLNSNTISNGTIRVDNELNLLNTNNIDQFVYYDYNEVNKLSEDTLSGVNYDFLTYYTYSNIISAEKTFANLNFFNLKNHISDKNVTYGGPLENRDDNLEYRGREYQNFTNQKSKEKDYDNLSLNYTFFDKEYKIGSKGYTEFTLPDNLFPFKKININDTGLALNGSFAASNPYFSDKVFKLTDRNKNNLQSSFIEDEEFLVLENDLSLFVLQSGDLFGFENINDIQNNDIFGDYLCTWLKGDGIEKGVWFDRYYLPKENSYTLPFSGELNQYNDSSQAAEHFKNNQTDSIYFDLKSNMTFEPSASYGYQRINKKQIDTFINSQGDKMLLSSYTIQTSSVQLQNIDEVDLNIIKGFDNIDIEAIPNRDFNIGFELELDTLSSLNSFQLFGNLYEDGFTFRNNHYFTPFIFIPQGNELNIYDNNFKLLRTNKYDSTENIIDVLYLEQNNNIVLVCDNKIIKTNFYGETLNERVPVVDGFTSDLVLEIIKGYKSRTYYGYNNLFIITNKYLTDNFIINFDLNNLLPTENLGLQSLYKSDPLSAAYHSIVPGLTGSHRYLIGTEPKKLNENVACSLDTANRFISKQNIPAEAFLNSPFLSADLSGVTDKLSGLSANFAGIVAGQSFDADYMSLIFAATADPLFNDTFLTFFDFIQDGRARIIFDNLALPEKEDPILDSINSEIYDINSVGDRLFVQYINISASEGFIQEFTPERFKLSAYQLSETVHTGYKIDFLEENKELKIVSFARDLSSNIVIDKINATTGVVEKTQTLILTGIDTTKRTVYAAKEAIPVTQLVTSTKSITSQYPKGIYKYRRVEVDEYSTILDFDGSFSTKFQLLSNNTPLFNPINYYAVDQKYNNYRDQLIFKFNLNSLLDIKTLSELWERAGPPLSATGYASFTWSNPGAPLSGWDGELVPILTEDVTNVEIIFNVPNISITNYFNINLDLNAGKIQLYNNGVVIGEVSFNPNLIPIERIIYPELFINSQNIRNTPIDNIVKDISYSSSGGTLKNLKVHNTSFDLSLINYLELQTKSIDPLYFRVPSGTRNSNEEIDTLFTYNIPGNTSNYIKVNIKDIDINNDVKQQLINYLQSSVEITTPSQQKLIYNVD